MMLRKYALIAKLWLLPLVLLLALCSNLLQPTAVLRAAESGPRQAPAPQRSSAPLAVPLDPSGDTDTSFDTDGIALANFATVYSFAASRAAVRQSTGKIVMAGESVDNGQSHIGLLRLTTSGLQDPTWGNGGEAKLAIGSSDLINDAAVQADDKVVAVGFSNMPLNVFTIVRYLPDGGLDTAFGGSNTGYIQVDFESVTSPLQRANAVAIQDDGKIVVAGYRRDNTTDPTFGGGDDVALVRLNTNGTIDTSFGNGGKVVTAVAAANGSDQAWDVQIIGSGASRKILIGGRTKPSGDNPQNLLLVRYNNNGSLDTTFDGDGIKVTDIPGNSCWPQGFACGGESIRAMAIQPDGKIVTTGGHERYEQFPSTSGATDTDMLTVRFNADGSLDTGFGGANASNNPNGGPGYVITSVARGYYTDMGLSIAVQTDGKIVSFGYTDQSEDFPAFVPPDYDFYYNQNFLFQRLNADGSRDSSFGPSPAGTFFQPGTVVPPGVVVVDLSEEGKTYDIGHAVVLQPDGKIVGGGRRTYQDNAISDTYFGAARLNANGTVDYTYGPDKNTTGSLNGTPDGTPDGYFYAQMLGGSIDVTNGIARQSDGKVVLVGSTNIGGSQTRFALARFNLDGSLDTSFSGDGLATAGAPGQLTHNATAVAIQSDGKIVVTGESSSGVGAPALTTMRFNTDGSLDTSFSGDGIATNVWGTNANAAFAVAIQTNGKILVGGSVSSSAADWDWLLLRYNADGTLDTSFSGDGMLSRTIGAGQNYDYIHSIVVQPDGNIVVGGYSSSSSGPNLGTVFALARYTSAGAQDNTFNGGNVVLTRLSHASQQYAGDQIRGLALMADGRIVAGGKALNASGYNTFALARYMPNGTLDTSFDGDGRKTHNVSANTMDEIMGISLQHDEKIVVFGNSLNLNSGSADVEVARFNWDDGSLDDTYATNGYILTNISGYDRPVGGVVIPSGATGAGKAVLGANPGSADFAALRYLGDPTPTQPGMLDLTNASDKGRSNSDNITNDNTPTFSGACETGETVILKVDNAVTSPLSRAICRSGAYNVTAAVAVADGTHTFSVFSRNSYGDSGSTGTISVVIDTVALPPNINYPAAGSTLLPEPTISGDGAETTADLAVTEAGNPVCSSQANAAGVWSCDSTLGPGSYTVSARQTDIAGNTSAAATRSFSIKAPTTTTLASSGDPTVYGQPVSFTATVTSGYGTPDGTVQFVVDSGSPISVTLSAAGTATLTRSNLSVGAHAIEANYQGATLYFPSSGGPLAHTVNKADSAISITSSANPSVVGQSVTLTAQVTAVAPGAGLPTGTVIFKDAETIISTQTLDSAGKATFTSSALTLGAHAITVVYDGDGNFNPSGGAVLTQTVDKASTTTAITADTPDPSVVGQAVTFDYAVNITSPGAGSLTGNVTVSDGTNSCTASVGAGSCTITLTTPSSGSFTASYSGDANFKPSSSSPPTAHTTNKADTSTAIVSHTPTSSVFGQPVVVSYIVDVTAPGIGTPTGDVTIGDGTTSCTASVSAGSCTITFTSAGTKNLTAVYAGDSNFASSSSAAPTAHTVNQAATTTEITADPSDPSVVGQPVAISYSVQVVAPGAGTPTGNVTVSDGTNSCTASVAAGTCTMIPANPASTAFVATYSGDVNFSGSASAAENHTIERAHTRTIITAHTPDPSLIGESVTISYTVEVVAPGSGTPTGSVTVSDGTQTCTGSVAAGSCTIAFARLGSANLTATYAGDGSFTGSSSAAEPHQVNLTGTTTTITSDTPDPSLVGQAVTVQYSVAISGPGSGTPTGNVTVSDGTDSCTGTVAAGQCTLTLTSAGARSLTARYAGDSTFGGSISAAEPHQVDKADTTITITANTPDPSAMGQPVTVQYSVAVSGLGSGTPTGNVTVSDGTDSCTGTVAAGQCTIIFSNPGATTLTAAYAGDSNFNGSTSAGVPHTVTINHAPSAQPNSYTTSEETPLSVTKPGVLANDSDADVGDTLTAVLGSGPSQAAAFSLNADGSFSYTPKPNFNGSDSFTYKSSDNHNVESAAATVTINVSAVNDKPSFTKGPDVTVAVAGPYSAGWATAISAGSANESGQGLTFLVTGNTNPGLFSAAPSIAANGALTFTPAPNANGQAAITVVLKDNGGTANGGQDISAPQTFTITVTSTSQRRLYLPMIIRPVAVAAAPDLVVTGISLIPYKSTFQAGEGVEVRVTVTNQGSAAAGAFWVDFYINPSSPPTAANQVWNTRCTLTPCFGMAWEVTSGLAPGQSITLSSQSLPAGYSLWPGYFAAGTSDLYAYADSYNPGVVAGSVAESNETNNRGELHGLSVTGPNPTLVGIRGVKDLLSRPVHLRK